MIKREEMTITYSKTLASYWATILLGMLCFGSVSAQNPTIDSLWQAVEAAETPEYRVDELNYLAEAYTDQDLIELKYEGQTFRAIESIKTFQQAVENLSFSPDFITIFSGYDAHREDCGEEITNWNDDSLSS